MTREEKIARMSSKMARALQAIDVLCVDTINDNEEVSDVSQLAEIVLDISTAAAIKCKDIMKAD